jgi:hypothetical protein
LVQSEGNDLNDMLEKAMDDVKGQMFRLTQTWRDAEERKAAVVPPPMAQRLPAMRTGHQFGDELKGPPSQSGPSPFLNFGGTPPFGTQPDISVRSSPSASPRRDGLKSPVGGKLPPVGKLHHTSILKRLETNKLYQGMFYASPERGTGTRSPMIGGSPSRRVQ